MSVKVSVIMSAYNAEDYIGEAISSVLNQSFKAFELLVTDDCSDDKTLSIIKTFNDSRIRLIQNTERQGLTANLNKMIDIAKGEYIARLDADDISRKDRLQKQIDFLDNTNDCFVVCSYADRIGDERGLTKTPNKSEDIAAELLFKSIIVHSSVMFRNSGYKYDPEYKKCQDYELWTRLISQGKKIMTIPEPLVFFRCHKGQISFNNKGEQRHFGIMSMFNLLNRIGLKLSEYDKNRYIKWMFDHEIESEEHLDFLDNLLSQINRYAAESGMFKKSSINKAVKGMKYSLIMDTKKQGIKISYIKELKLLIRSFSVNTVKKIIYNKILYKYLGGI